MCVCVLCNGVAIILEYSLIRNKNKNQIIAFQVHFGDLFTHKYQMIIEIAILQGIFDGVRAQNKRLVFSSFSRSNIHLKCKYFCAG